MLKRCHAYVNSKCNHSREHNYNEVLKWRHSVGSSSSYPYQSRYKHTSNACSKQRAKIQMACEKSGFKSDRPLVGPIETQCSCRTAATKSQGAHVCYSSDTCGLFHTFYQWEHGLLLMRYQVDVQSIETN